MRKRVRMSDETVAQALGAMDAEQFRALMRAAIEWAARHGLTIDGHFEAHYGITAEVAAAVRAELVRTCVARPADGADGMWFINAPVAEIALRADHAEAALAAERRSHQTTRVDLERNIHAGRVARDESARVLRLAKAAHLRAEDDLSAAKRHVRILAAAALVLALALVWAVIA